MCHRPHSEMAKFNGLNMRYVIYYNVHYCFDHQTQVYYCYLFFVPKTLLEEFKLKKIDVQFIGFNI